jgi:hypothetical protein
MTTTEKLLRLKVALGEMVAMMRLDPKSQWTEKFASDLDICESLLHTKPAPEELVAISQSITEVYKGMGSFNDYEPAVFDPANGRYTPIPGTEGFSTLASEVFNIAVDLRTSA